MCEDAEDGDSREKKKGDTMQDPSMPGALELMFIPCFIFGGIIFGVLLTVFPFWKICTKAGFPGPLALLMLVPIANIILPFYLAFADWPALRQAGARPPGTL